MKLIESVYEEIGARVSIVTGDVLVSPEGRSFCVVSATRVKRRKNVWNLKSVELNTKRRKRPFQWVE